MSLPWKYRKKRECVYPVLVLTFLMFICLANTVVTSASLSTPAKKQHMWPLALPNPPFLHVAHALWTYLDPGHSMLETSPAPWPILLCGEAGHKVLGWCNAETWRGARRPYFPGGCLWRGWPSPGPGAKLCRPAANSQSGGSCPSGPGWTTRSTGASCPSHWGRSPPGTPAGCPSAAWLAAWTPISVSPRASHSEARPSPRAPHPWTFASRASWSTCVSWPGGWTRCRRWHGREEEVPRWRDEIHPGAGRRRRKCNQKHVALKKPVCSTVNLRQNKNHRILLGVIGIKLQTEHFFPSSFTIKA